MLVHLIKDCVTRCGPLTLHASASSLSAPYSPCKPSITLGSAFQWLVFLFLEQHFSLAGPF